MQSALGSKESFWPKDLRPSTQITEAPASDPQGRAPAVPALAGEEQQRLHSDSGLNSHNEQIDG